MKELDKNELKKIEGGLLGELLVGAAIAAVVEIIGDWDNFERGLTGQPYKSK